MVPISPKFLYIIRQRSGSLIGYGAAAGLLGTYITSEWIGKNVLKYVPLYNGKYNAIERAKYE